MQISQKPTHFSPLVLFSPPAPIPEGEVLGRIKAQTLLIDAALHPFADTKTIEACLLIQSDILEQINMLFEKSTDSIKRDMATNLLSPLPSISDALSPQALAITQKAILSDQKSVMLKIISLLEQPPKEPTRDSSGPSSSSSSSRSTDSGSSPLPTTFYLGSRYVSDEIARERILNISSPISNVDLLNHRLTDATLRLLAERCDKLTSLALGRTRTIEATLRLFAEKCDKLTHLSLTDTEASEAILQLFAERCDKLTRLGLDNTKASDTTLQLFAKRCNQLEFLYLGNTAVTNATLQLFAEKSSNLLGLCLKGTAATDATLRLFAERCNKLIQADLSLATVTDATIVAFVTRNPSLKTLVLYRTKATPELTRKISQINPGITIRCIPESTTSTHPSTGPSASSATSGSSSTQKRSERPIKEIDLTQDDDENGTKRARTS